MQANQCHSETRRALGRQWHITICEKVGERRKGDLEGKKEGNREDGEERERGWSEGRWHDDT